MKELTAKLLVVEDDPELREAFVDTLELAGCEVIQADSGEAALEVLSQQMVDMVISDINMGKMSGLDLLKTLRKNMPQLPVLLMTAFGSINASVDAIRHGAVDYLVKPFKPQILIDTVSRYVSTTGFDDEDMPVAEEASSQQLLKLAERVAQTDSTVLICGESGTGKEVMARFIHQQSARSKKPFVALNCAAIPENMLEGMLFGHEKGAFTGAYSSAPGKFEQANGGTILLDEISEMEIGLQAKLLRVIQEREVERLGGRKTIPLDVRILATTNRNLAEAVREGKFREDLYYRLSVFPIQWLPLRERPSDIVPIAKKLLNNHLLKMGRQPASFDESAVAALEKHPWPGNVRELDNVVQRALIMQAGPVISDADLRLDPFDLAALQNESLAEEAKVTPIQKKSAVGTGTDNSETVALGSDLQQREFEIILETLRNEGGSRKNTAEKLGISPRTLRYKLAKMKDEGIDVKMMLQTA